MGHVFFASQLQWHFEFAFSRAGLSLVRYWYPIAKSRAKPQDPTPSNPCFASAGYGIELSAVMRSQEAFFFRLFEVVESPELWHRVDHRSDGAAV